MFLASCSPGERGGGGMRRKRWRAAEMAAAVARGSHAMKGAARAGHAVQGAAQAGRGGGSTRVRARALPRAHFADIEVDDFELVAGAGVVGALQDGDDGLKDGGLEAVVVLVRHVQRELLSKAQSEGARGGRWCVGVGGGGEVTERWDRGRRRRKRRGSMAPSRGPTPRVSLSPAAAVTLHRCNRPRATGRARDLPLLSLSRSCRRRAHEFRTGHDLRPGRDGDVVQLRQLDAAVTFAEVVGHQVEDLSARDEQRAVLPLALPVDLHDLEREEHRLVRGRVRGHRLEGLRATGKGCRRVIPRGHREAAPHAQPEGGREAAKWRVNGASGASAGACGLG